MTGQSSLQGQIPQLVNKINHGQHQYNDTSPDVTHLDNSQLQSATRVLDQSRHERVAGIVSLLEGGGGSENLK